MNRFGRTTWLTAIFLLVVTAAFGTRLSHVQAADTVPRSISYQGRLYSSGGSLLGGSGTTYCFKFSFWDDATVGAGSRLWPTGAPSANQLNVKNGVFSANIGIDTADALTYNFDDDTTYLQVEIAPYSGSCGSYETLSPRQRIVASGYAVNSDLLDGADAGTGVNNILKLDGSGNIGLTATNPVIKASGTNTLTLQGGLTGDLLFYSSSNKITSAGDLTVAGSGTFGSTLTFGTSNTTDASLTFKNATNTNTVAIQTGATATSYTLTLPTLQGGAGTYLKNDGSGVLSWQSGSSICTNCILNNSSATDATNTVAPTTDVTSLTLLQTSAGSPTKNIFAIKNSGATSTYFSVNSVGALTLAPAATEDVTVALAAGSTVAISASAAPTSTLVTISNSGNGTTTADANGLGINFEGGSAAVEAAGLRVDLKPGGTSGGTWSGMRIVADSTGAASGVTEYGLKVEGPSSPGSGSEIGLSIGSGWDIGLSLVSGGIQMAAISDPAAPGSGNLRVWAKKVANRNSLFTRDENGNTPKALQNSLASTNICMITTGASSSVTSFGCSAANQGTVSHVASEASGYVADFTTAATSDAPAGTSSDTASFYRGSTTGANGYFYFSRMYLPGVLGNYSDTTTGSRLFFGLTNQTLTNAVASDDPAGHRSGFSMVPSRDTSSYHWQFVTKDGATEHVSDTGVTLAVGKVYDMYIYVPKQGSTIYWELQNITDATSASGSTSSNLPGGSTAMRAVAGIGTLEASNHSVQIQKLYVEADR